MNVLIIQYFDVRDLGLCFFSYQQSTSVSVNHDANVPLPYISSFLELGCDFNHRDGDQRLIRVVSGTLI